MSSFDCIYVDSSCVEIARKRLKNNGILFSLYMKFTRHAIEQKKQKLFCGFSIKNKTKVQHQAF
jgi:hypothetical protein